MNGRGEVGSPDPLDSFPRLKVRKSDGASRRSSCGGDSELERYCSANSMMGTPSTSMSMYSAITVFHDFSDNDFGSGRGFEDATSGLENFSLGGEGITIERNRNDRKRNLRYGSSGLELYGDSGDELAMTALDSSELFGFNRTGESDVNVDGNGNGNGDEVEVEGKEMEREEDEEFSEGEDSMFNYGSGCDGDNENENEFYSRRGDDGDNEFYSSRGEQLYEEAEVRSESALLMNSSVAFGSHDLDDFLLQNPVSAVSDLFYNPRGNKERVEEGGVSSSKKEKNVVIVNEEVGETKDIGGTEAMEEDNDRDGDKEAPAACCEVQGSDNLVACSRTSSICEGKLGLLPEEDPQKSLNVTDSGSEEKGNQYINSDEAAATVDSSRVDESSSNPSASVGNMNAKSFENLEQIRIPSNFGVRKILESSPTSTNLLEKSPVTPTVSNESHCLSSYCFQSCLIFVFAASICTILIKMLPLQRFQIVVVVELWSQLHDGYCVL